MVDGLHGLGHDAVVSGHHQHGDVRHLGAAGAHGGEGGVAGGVQEGDFPAVHLHTVGADVLGDAAGLALGDVGVADDVQNGGLAVVHVAHDHHNGGPGHQVGLIVLAVVDDALLDGDHHFLLHLGVELVGHQHGGVKVDGVVDGGEHAQAHQLLDDLGGGRRPSAAGRTRPR